MDANFKKFKKRVWFYILIKCACAGLAAGLIAVNCVLLPCKLYGVELFWLYYVLIALGGVLLGGGVAFLFLRTNDKKIAVRLDEELKLDERVQTAYLYSGQSSDILDLQRENAGAILGGISVKTLPFKNLVATILCAAIAFTGLVAAPVVATCVPPVFAQTGGEEEPYDPPRPVTDWEWAALDELINYVKASKKADTATKTGIVGELEGLRAVLVEGVSQNSLPGFVQNTVTGIRNAVVNANDKATDEQRALNSEEESYVITRLYEIFSLKRPNDNMGGGGDDTQEPDPNDPENPGGSGSEGEDSKNTVPFYDPVLGYVILDDVREEYYERVQTALEEGTISREEWELIMVTYFADLNKKD